MIEKVTLPVDAFEEEILDTVRNHPVTIIVAETGAGKSTRVPYMIMNGLSRSVIVTEPRRIITEVLATRTSEENNLVLGDLIGFKTSVSEAVSSETRCLYCTDGLQLVRELAESKYSVKNGIVLILDEVHEFNENVETLLAWCKQLILDKVDIKVIVMSASLEHKTMSEYFNGAPVIHIPGRAFPVFGAPSDFSGPHQLPAKDLVGQVRKNASLYRNILVFLPGKTEISEIEAQLKETFLDAEILILHSEMSPEDQMKVFESYDVPKIVLSTNIAQTSLTIADIDYIVDSGLEKKVRLVNGVETLVLGCISKADVRQRAGRAGRVKGGMYALCNDTPYELFDEYPTPEICQKLLDQMVLRLATADFDATLLDFFHQPDILLLKEARKILIDMEALTSEGKVTALGYEINRFPTSTIVARMIIESLRRKCLTKVLTFAAIMSNARSSIKLKHNAFKQYPEDVKFWHETIPGDKQYNSDLFVEFDLWDLAFKNLNLFAQNGVDKKSYMDSVEIRQRLKSIVSVLGYGIGPEYNINAEDQTEVLKCITAGMIHHVYKHVKEGRYVGVERRMLHNDSLIARKGFPDLVVGIPMNIPIRKSVDSFARVLTNCTVIELSWLKEIAPGLVKETVEAVKWNQSRLELTYDTVTVFNDREVHRMSTPLRWSAENLHTLVTALATVFLDKDKPATAWINRLRYMFSKRNPGQDFAKEFMRALYPFRTLQIVELEHHQKEIEQSVLNPVKLPPLHYDNYVSWVHNFAVKLSAELTFDLSEEKSKTTRFSAVCRLAYKSSFFETRSDASHTSKMLAKHDASKKMYAKLSEIF